MLDYTQELTSEEIWQDCFLERCSEVMRCLRGGFEGVEIMLDETEELPGKNARLTVVVVGLDFPLVYDFNVSAVPGSSFRITPLTEEFIMMSNPYIDGYDLAQPGTGKHISHWVNDIMMNYHNEQLTAQPLDDRVMRAEYQGYQP